MPFGRKKRMKPEDFKNLVALRARGYIPEIKSFLEKDFSSRQEVIDSLWELDKSLTKPMEELDKKSPDPDGLLFLKSLGTLYFNLKRDKYWKPFVEGKNGAVDDFGNLHMLTVAFSCILGVSLSTYIGLQGWSEIKDVEGTDFHSITVAIDQKAGKGALKEASDLQIVMPMIEEIEKELSQFPPNDELERLLAK